MDATRQFSTADGNVEHCLVKEEKEEKAGEDDGADKAVMVVVMGDGEGIV